MNNDPLFKDNDPNPFSKKKVSEAYKDADPVYKESARLAISFMSPLGKGLVVDIGGGTGISTQAILEAGPKILCLLDPSEAMISQAKKRLEDKVRYIQLPVERMCEEFNDTVDLAYALNCFHLFPDARSAVLNISGALKSGGIFVFNICSPSYYFNSINSDELDVIKSNIDFYSSLHQANQEQSKVLANTVKLLTEAIHSKGELVYTKDKIKLLFSYANMMMLDQEETVISIEPYYQKNIWRLIASGYISDEQQIEDIINNTYIPDVVRIRQGFFKMAKMG